MEKELADSPPSDAHWPRRQYERAGEGTPCDVGIKGLGMLGRRLCREEMMAQEVEGGGGTLWCRLDACEPGSSSSATPLNRSTL